MKKIILTLFLLYSCIAFSQIDTANYSFNMDLLTGKFNSIISKSTIYGAGGFRYVVQNLETTSIDTTLFQYVGNSLDGKYTIMQNISSYYGKDSGTVQFNLVNNSSTSNSFTADSSNILFKNRNRTITSRFIFSDKQSFTDTLDVNKLIADSITVGFINGSAYNPFDSSQYVKRSAFSQSIAATGGAFTFSSIAGFSFNHIASFDTIQVTTVKTAQDMTFNAPTGTIEFIADGFSIVGATFATDVDVTTILVGGEGGWQFAKDGGSGSPAVTPAMMVIKTISFSDGTSIQVYTPVP